VLASVLLGRTLVGVLVLYRRRTGRSRVQRRSRCAPRRAGGIAVENVILHRDAERWRSPTRSPVSWNFRYLSMSLAREIDRRRGSAPARRAHARPRPLQEVNDTYGHARGDAVLRELAARSPSRCARSTRWPATAARSSSSCCRRRRRTAPRCWPSASAGRSAGARSVGDGASHPLRHRSRSASPPSPRTAEPGHPACTPRTRRSTSRSAPVATPGGWPATRRSRAVPPTRAARGAGTPGRARSPAGGGREIGGETVAAVEDLG
jgi:hypothetical protein